MVKLLAIASIICGVIVLAGVNRGFDISDEGLYVLLADPLQENVAGIFNYDLFFKLFFEITGHSFSLIALRIIRLITYLAGALALAGFWKNIKSEQGLSGEIFWIAFLGLAAGYAFLPPTLSYNSLAVVLICCWLNIISCQKVTWTTLLCLGIVLSLLIYVKITVALIFFPMTFLILLFLKKFTPLSAIAMVAPLIVFELVFLLVLGENAFIRLSDGISLNYQRPGYQVGLMVKSIAVGVFWIVVPGLLFLAFGYMKRMNAKFANVVFIAAVMVTLSVSYLTHITVEWNHLVMILSASFFGFYLGFLGKRKESPGYWTVLLFCLPFIMHLGSNVYWLRIGIQYWVFWILAIILSFESLQARFYQVVAILSVLLVFDGIWWHPFGQDEPLWTRKVSWIRGENEVVQVDPDLAAILFRMKEWGIPESTGPFLAAYRIPGLLWLCGGQVLHSPGIWDQGQLKNLFDSVPDAIIYSNQGELPANWIFTSQQDLGVFQGDTLKLLWD